MKDYSVQKKTKKWVSFIQKVVGSSVVEEVLSLKDYKSNFNEAAEGLSLTPESDDSAFFEMLLLFNLVYTDCLISRDVFSFIDIIQAEFGSLNLTTKSLDLFMCSADGNELYSSLNNELISFFMTTQAKVKKGSSHRLFAYIKKLSPKEQLCFWGDNFAKVYQQIFQLKTPLSLIVSDYKKYIWQSELHAITKLNKNVFCITKKIEDKNIIHSLSVLSQLFGYVFVVESKNLTNTLSTNINFPLIILGEVSQGVELDNTIYFVPTQPQAGVWAKVLTSFGFCIDQASLMRLDSIFSHLPVSDIYSIVKEFKLLGYQEDALKFDEIVKKIKLKSSNELEKHADKITPKYDMNDLVLPADLKLKLYTLTDYISNLSQIEKDWKFKQKHNRGHAVVSVFKGSSGTGKTMAAEAVANELGLDLYRVDLSKVTSKYIGETEKNLGRIFRLARENSGILFFDEGETLFSKRMETKSSQDKYANLEVNYLLQELEAHNGIVIISTNLAGSIDKAFLRRITFQFHFPIATEESKVLIWKSHIKEGLPLSADIDYEALAKVDLSPGSIRNAVKIACGLASIRGDQLTMKDLWFSIKRESEKFSFEVKRELVGEAHWKDVSSDWERQRAHKLLTQRLKTTLNREANDEES